MTDKHSDFDITKIYQDSFSAHQRQEMSIREFLDACKKDPSMYASPHERLLKAIGKPESIDTSKDARLGRIFQNRILRIYPSFREHFYGNEAIIENIVSFLTRGAQGLHEKKLIMYLLGPVGGGKSSLVELLKELMEQEPFYALEANGVVSPVFESPLGLFAPQHLKRVLFEKFDIPGGSIPTTMSPWAAKRLKEFGGDINQFKVVRLFPSVLNQVAIAVTDPADENTQDISVLVGKTDIRRLDEFSQDDPDSYSFSGGLCRGGQGVLEFREMFKAPLKTLNPLLFATQEGSYKGTEGLGAIPFNGIIIAHSNESEWDTFKGNKRNEAFIDRINLIKVPYVLRATEEALIYKKMVDGSSLKDRPLAPETLKILARMCVLSRMAEPPKEEDWFLKLRVYDGENLKNTHPDAKPLHEYRDLAGINEGMSGLSTRFAFKALASTFNFDSEEVGANPVHLFVVLERAIRQEQFDEKKQNLLLNTLLPAVTQDFHKELGKDIRKAYIESYDEYGQNLFDKYIAYADHWIDDTDYQDTDTQTSFDRSALNTELEKIEKPAGIANPKDFRNEVVKYALRHRANSGGKNPSWSGYEKMREVIEKKMFANADELMPVISFGKKKDAKEEKQHRDFVDRMKQRGYTERQVRILVDWFMRVQKNS